MKKASTELLQQGTQTPSSAPDLIPAEKINGELTLRLEQQTGELQSRRSILGRAVAQWPVAMSLLVVVAAVWFQIQGMNRSLGEDESWVANAVLESSVSRMLFYDAWVPAPEPGFLLVSRLVTKWLGPSNLTFRIVPFAFSLLGLAAMGLLLRRLFTPVWLVVGFALFAASPPAIYYAHNFKQYSSQLAMAALLLLSATRCNERPSRWNFAALLLMIVVAMVFSYPSVFLLPAVVILLVRPKPGESIEPNRMKQAALAALLGLTVFLFLYFAVIRSNVNESLRLFFAHKNHAFGILGCLRRIGYSLLVPFKRLLPIPMRFLDSPARFLELVGGPGLLGIAAALYQVRRGYRPWVVVAVSLPILAVSCLDVVNRYPVTEKTTLFLLPCRVILVVSLLELVVATISALAPGPGWSRTLVWTAPVAATLIFGIGCLRERHAEPTVPVEDVQSAVAWLQENFRDGDALYVHASMQENFKLYTRLLAFNPSSVQWGNTGWPCCPRRVEYWEGLGSVHRMEEDIVRLYPVSIPERLWTLHSLRSDHWAYIGLDEGVLLRRLFLDRGCALEFYREWHNVGLSRFGCGASKQTMARVTSPMSSQFHGRQPR
jgi:hypothetical protein